jgi:quercetin 2,3-dioxygenase
MDPKVTSEPLVSFRSRDLDIGALHVARALPLKERRLIGPWCLLDRFGPLTFAGDKPMDVAPHPHTGMQTVTWLLDGEVLHDDSLGCEAVVRPGGVNVTTAGSGIAHAEQTPIRNSGRLSGVQLWVALPDVHRHIAPSFAAIERVPAVEHRGGLTQVIAGILGDGPSHASPGPHYSDLVAADVQVHAGGTVELGLDPRFEHAVLVLSGDCAIEDQALEDRRLYYLGPNRSGAAFGSRTGCRLLLIGGPPFAEPILMWWNFVARTQEEIAQARSDWEEHRRFGDVKAYRGERLRAPSLIRPARPNPIS